MKVTTACAGRFHFFDQARQLFRHRLLKSLVTDYPKLKTRQWGLPDEYVISRPHRALYNLAKKKASGWVGYETRSRWIESSHAQFARSLPIYVPSDSNVLISHSSFMLEALSWAKNEGMIAIVDHGSLHERAERQILLRECEEFNFSRFGNWQYDWLIEREDQEFGHADYIMVCSKLAKKSMVENGVPEGKVFVNPLGADLSMFHPGEKGDSKFRVVFCGGIGPRKGVHYLIRAFDELALPQAELWLIGSPPEDSVLKSLMKAYMKRDIVLKGTLPQHELKDLYSQGSVFVLPSLADGWGMVVLQAMACGLPVIVTDRTGAMEAVTDGVDGFVIPARSVEALKEKLLFLYENLELCEEMGRNAAVSVKKGFSWDDYGDRLCDFLEGAFRKHE